MTSRINKINRKNEAGISLMLSILILSAITAVAFSLASIVFIEVRSSGDVIRTEPALYATMGVTEEALFQYKRFISDEGGYAFDVPTCMPNAALVCDLNGVELTLPGTQPVQFDDSPRVQLVSAGETTILPMYTPTDFNRLYQDITLEILVGSTAEIDINFRKTDANGDVTDPVLALPVKLNVGDPAYVYNSFSQTGQYDLVLNNTSTQDINVAIWTNKVGGVVPSGFPYLGQQVLRIRADHLGLTRTYEVRIPIP